MRNFFARLRRDISANVLAIGGFGAMALIGGGGLAVDGVYWYLWKRQLQQAVDSGAMAGAYARTEGRSISGAANDDIGRNSNTSITVQAVNGPPLTGAWTGNATAVEVIATTSKALPFSSLFLSTPPQIYSRAVAAFVSEGEHCIISLAETGVGVDIAGTANVNLGCGIGANSQGAQAILLEGSSYMTGSPLSAVGGIDYESRNVPGTTNFNPYGYPLTDPLASRNLAPPSEPAACDYTAFEVAPSQTRTIYPGRYCNGLTLKGTVHMEPGVFIVDKGQLAITSQAEVDGEGVTFVLTGDNTGNIATTAIQGGAEIQLSAPTSAQDPTWQGILLFQDQRGSATRSELAGNSDFDLEGVIYMPGSTIRFAGTSGQQSECLLLVAHRVILTGTSSLDNDCPDDYADLDLSGRRMRIVE